MGDRLALNALLQTTLGSTHVYFQPPESIKMEYPCIVYSLDDIYVRHAGNVKYTKIKRYSVTVIDKNPDSLIPEKVLELPMCSFNRHFKSENLNHWVYTLYY